MDIKEIEDCFVVSLTEKMPHKRTTQIIIFCAAILAVKSTYQHGTASEASTISKEQDAHGNYAFSYEIIDNNGASNTRSEVGDAQGNKKGSYSLHDVDGRTRLVNYIADQHGFRVAISTNEPGTANSAPASAIIDSPYPAPQAAVVQDSPVVHGVPATSSTKSVVNHVAPAVTFTKKYVPPLAPASVVRSVPRTHSKSYTSHGTPRSVSYWAPATRAKVSAPISYPFTAYPFAATKDQSIYDNGFELDILGLGHNFYGHDGLHYGHASPFFNHRPPGYHLEGLPFGRGNYGGIKSIYY